MTAQASPMIILEEACTGFTRERRRANRTARFVIISHGRGSLAEHGAAYLLRQLDAPDKAIARRALDSLSASGPSATEPLYEAALVRDPEIETLRQAPCPEGVGGPVGWLTHINTQRFQNAVEIRADLSLAALAHAWNAGWLRERAQRRLLPYLEGFAFFVDTKPTISADQREIDVMVGDQRWVGAYLGKEQIWLKSRVEVLVDGMECGCVKNPELKWWNERVLDAQPPKDGSPLSAFDGSGGGRGLSTYRLDATQLRPGKHQLAVRVLLGPGEPTRREATDTPPPWYETLALGPAEFEMAEPSSHEE
jgi:hypothetical protein